MNLVRYALVAVFLLGTACDKESNNTPTETPEVVEIPITAKSLEAVELFKEGRDLVESIRGPQAREKFEEALKLDPEFALAHSYMAFLSNGRTSEYHRNRATSLSVFLPEAEKQFIAAAVAAHRGDRAATAAALDALQKEAPGSWRVQEMSGEFYIQYGDREKGLAAFERVAQLNPKRGPALNMLAYMYGFEGDHAKAIATVNKYIAITPGEPNAHDTKADLLLLAGKFEDAEASYAKAAKVDPKFAWAHDGIAATRFYRGDWDGGIDALKDGVKASTLASEKFSMQWGIAMAHAAAGQEAEATKLIDTDLKDAIKEAELAPGWVDFAHARVHAHAGRWKEAHAAMTKGWPSIQKDPGNADRTREAAAMRAGVAVRAGDKATAANMLAFLEESADTDDEARYARAHVAWGEGDVDAAIALFDDAQWQWETASKMAAADALLEAGDKEAANKLYGELATTRYQRDLNSVLCWQHAKKSYVVPTES